MLPRLSSLLQLPQRCLHPGAAVLEHRNAPAGKQPEHRRHFRQPSFTADGLGPAHQLASRAQHVPRAQWVLLGHPTTSSMQGKRTLQKARGYGLHVSLRKTEQLERV